MRMDSVSILAAAVALCAVLGEVLVKGWPSYISAGLLVATLGFLALRALPIEMQPAPVSMGLGVIGAALMAAGVTYHLTSAHWKGREFYIPNVDQLIISSHQHLESLAFAINDDDYLKRQTEAAKMLWNQASWVNHNMGGATVRALLAAQPLGECARSDKFSDVINDRRCDYIRLIRGRIAFLEKLKADGKWPQSPKEIVKDPQIR